MEVRILISHTLSRCSTSVLRRAPIASQAISYRSYSSA